MGAALLLVWERDAIGPETEADFAAVLAAFPGHVRRMPCARRATAQVRVALWAHGQARCQGFADEPASGAWLGAIGNPTRGDLRGVDGQELLGRLLRELLHPGAESLATLSPPFAWVGRSADGAVHVAVDRAGLQHLYCATDAHDRVWLSSSLLALLTVVEARPDPAAVAEWLTAGHFVSQRTLFHGIRKLQPGERLRLEPARCTRASVWRPEPGTGAATLGNAPLPAYRAAFTASLAASSGGPDVASELTGGLDSRLVLAGLVGRPDPFLTWTFGQEGCGELRTIARLRRAAPFTHHLVPITGAFAATLPERVQEWHELSDGEVNALEYAPLLLAFAGLDGRRVTSLSGAGGEIARGFYYAAARGAGPRGVGVAALLRKLSAAAGPLPTLLRRDQAGAPGEHLQQAVHEFLASSPGRDAHDVLDDFYLRARMQRFAGRNVTTTGLFCRQGLPYFGNELVDLCRALPTAWKRDGRVVRATLADLVPALAAIPLESGLSARPGSWLRPDALLRRGWSLGRKFLRRRVPAIGRRLTGSVPDTLPWDAARHAPAVRAWVTDLLLDRAAATRAWIEPAAATTLVQAAWAGAPLFPLGLLLTLELTLRRAQAARATAPRLQAAARV